MKKTLLFFFILFSTTTLWSQALNILQSPVYTMPCDSNCVKLNVTYAKPKQTNTYSVSSVTYAPTTFTGGTPVTMYDDSFTTSIPIGFTFCYFGLPYTQVCFSDNGVLTFNTGAYALGVSNNNTLQTLPYFNSTFPDNSIFFPFLDLDPVQGGSVKYTTIGTAPNRKFIVQYTGFKLFGVTCSNNTSSFQLELTETSNTIEMFIASKATCDADPTNESNYATVGIQNMNAITAITAPGRHASIWTATNEAWRFEPAGTLAYTLNWYSPLGNYAVIATNVDSINVCPPYYPFKVWTTYSTLCPAGFHTDTVTILKHDPYIDSTVIVKPLCNGDSSGQITVYGNGLYAPIQYSFMGSPFSSNNHWTGLPVGTFQVQLKDSIGCTKTFGITLTPANNPVIVLDSLIKPTCPDTNGHIHIHVINGTPPYTINWSNGDTGPTADSLAGGIITATVTDSNGCHVNYSFLVGWDSLPVVTYTVTKPVCGDSSGLIQLTVTSGTPNYIFSWNTGDSTYFIDSLHAGLYSVLVKDANNCATNLTFLLQDTLNLKTDSAFIGTICGLNNGVAYVLPSNGVAPYTFLWSNGSTNDTVTNFAAGTQWCITTDNNGCVEVDSFYINTSQPLTNIISFANSNCDSSNGKIFTTPGGYTPPLGYLWNTGSINTSLTNLAAGTYWVKITDVNGCSRTDTIHINEDGKPLLVIDAYTPPTCYGDSNGSVTLSGLQGTAPYKYSLDGILFSSIAVLNDIGGGNYLIYIRDANGCTADTIVNFVQPDSMGVKYASDTLICYNDDNANIVLHPFGGTSPIVYSFDGKPYGTDTLFSGYEIGTYKLIIKDGHNCLDSFNIYVNGPGAPLEIEIEKRDVSCLDSNNGYIIARGRNGWGKYSYLWTSGDTTQYQSQLRWGTYGIVVSDAKGCTTTKVVQVNQEHCCNVVVPNAFTPNNDLLNDILTPIVISEVEKFQFNIMDRYGHTIFSTSTTGQGWNGRDLKGNAYEIGTYFYFLKYKCSFDDETHVLKGDITMYR